VALGDIGGPKKIEARIQDKICVKGVAILADFYKTTSFSCLDGLYV
jgi:hypothetical protein